MRITKTKQLTGTSSTIVLVVRYSSTSSTTQQILVPYKYHIRTDGFIDRNYHNLIVIVIVIVVSIILAVSIVTAGIVIHRNVLITKGIGPSIHGTGTVTR
jgi:hypothetical protein